MLKQDRIIKTKKGAASLFVVIFTIILLGVVTLGFTRIMLSDASRTSNNDLSQSAYDSALAGVEDAKVALLKYHQCIYTGADSQECVEIRKAMENGMKEGSCDVVANVLGRKTSSEKGETPIRETTSDNNSSYMDQAYTCVTIQEDLSDYRFTLNASSYPHLVPLQAANPSEVKKIQFNWYVPSNYSNISDKPINDNFGTASNEANQPPLVAIQFVQTDKTFQLSELTASKDENSSDRATIYLKPSSDIRYKDAIISAAEMSTSANKSPESSPINNQEPHHVYCDKQASDYACKATIILPNTFKGSTDRHPDAFFLVVSLPYRQPETDFAVQMQNDNGEAINFSGAQARVDSTGRANELYRRVESRIELTDVYFPYPEYAIQLSGDGDEGDINKNFYVTDNCWNSNNGTKSTCKNSKNL